MKRGIGTASFPFVDPRQDPRPDGDEPLRWYFDRRAGTVQGPLEMASFRDRSLLVALEPGQVGLLVESGEIRAVFLTGSHLLRVGEGPERVDPRARLIMLDTERPLPVRWGETSPESEPRRAGAPDAPPPGSAGIAIVDPARFHAAFLRNSESCGEQFLQRLIGVLVQSRLEGLISPWRAAGSPAEATTLSERLASLAPGDLNASLEPYGIACTALRWDPVAPPARETQPTPAELVPA